MRPRLGYFVWILNDAEQAVGILDRSSRIDGALGTHYQLPASKEIRNEERTRRRGWGGRSHTSMDIIGNCTMAKGRGIQADQLIRDTTVSSIDGNRGFCRIELNYYTTSLLSLSSVPVCVQHELLKLHK